MILSLHPKHKTMKKYTYEIVQDFDPSNPRTEWDNVTTMLCFHKRYNLGDKQNINFNDYESWDEMENAIKEKYDVLMIKPLYMYEHSGIAISTSPFSCPWDSGRIGFIIVDTKQYELCMGDPKDAKGEVLEGIIKNDIEIYNKYLCGDVYGYKTFEVETCNKGCEHKTMIDSCWGYYDEADAEAEAKSLIEHYEKENAVA